MVFLPSFIIAAASPTPTVGPGFAYNHFAVDGYVYAITKTANDLYIGGDFTLLGRRIGPLMYGNSFGTPNLSYPQVNGYVYAVTPDGSGGFYVGGLFTHVAGQKRDNIAHILSGGELDTAWTPAANDAVRAITIVNGNIVIGGNFTTAAGNDGIYKTRNKIAFINSLGNLIDYSTNPDLGISGGVFDLHSYSTYGVFVGGSFTQVNGDLTRKYCVMLNTNTGVLYTYDYKLNGAVYGIAMAGNQLYLGGSFTAAGGATVRNRIAMFSSFSTITPAAFFDPNVNSTVYDLHFDTATNNLYATGFFTTVNGGTVRNYAAAFVTTTGSATSWNPNLDNYGYSLSADGSNIYIGGGFKRISGSIVKLFSAAFNKTTGSYISSFSPNLNGPVYSLAAGMGSGTDVVIGGGFSGYGSVERNRLAKVYVYSNGDWGGDISMEPEC